MVPLLRLAWIKIGETGAAIVIEGANAAQVAKGRAANEL